jgi:hypothetical protein
MCNPDGDSCGLRNYYMQQELEKLLEGISEGKIE